MCHDSGNRLICRKNGACFAWEPAPCGESEICQDGACIDQTCDDECMQNEYACDGDVLQACVLKDGCYAWTTAKTCENGCKNGACLEKPACQNACTPNERTCDKDSVQSCVLKDGCYAWTTAQKCENGCKNGACVAAVYEKTRYSADRILSPITPYSVDQMKAIAAKKSSRNGSSFIKMGDSHMYSQSYFMYCFSESNSKHNGYNLNGLPFSNVASAFQSNFDSFSRISGATILGETANLPIKNNFALLNAEISAANPRFAFYGFGSNDMGWYDYRKFKTSTNGGYFAAMQLYFRNVLKAMDALIDNGVIPLLIGTGRRTDTVTYYKTSTVAADRDQPRHFVTTFNAVSRGIAEYYQIPYYDLQLSHANASNFGLSGDGLHHTQKNNGCDFTASGLLAGANLRNRYAIEMLDRAWRTVVKGEAAPDKTTEVFKGTGTQNSPFEIHTLPYTHLHTSVGGESRLSSYSCQSGTSEAGPERVYKMTLNEATRIRAVALSATSVDVDLHLLSSLNANQCVVRGDKWVEANLSAGTYYFVVDTYQSNANAGLYLLAVHACDADDADCGSKNTGE